MEATDDKTRRGEKKFINVLVFLFHSTTLTGVQGMAMAPKEKHIC
jgi:hypothetical protein